jgi:outer membrane lipoprotein-sorting protein
MKRLSILLPALLIASVCSAQSLDEIVNKYYEANGIEKLEKANTVYLEGRASQMGTEMPMTISVKKPDKVKVVITYSGMEIITMYDGEKGYMVNPLAGLTEPMELPEEQLSGVKENNMLRNNVLDAFRAGKLKLEGDENVNGRPAFKLALTSESGEVSGLFIDKESYLTVKTTTKVSQMGQEMEVESYISEYHDVNGIKFAKVITQMVNGVEMGVMTFDKVEIDREIADSVFTIK